VRKLTKALTVVSLLAPVSGYPLGIGDIRVRSALNQNLNAEINLVASRGENPSNIKVSLASADKFDEAGIPWTYFLSKLRFQPVVKANGAMVIKVTSREALKEPYLNFLLEVSWPKGNLYREFTVLVDPPADYQHESYQEPVYQEPVYPSASTYDVMPRMERQEYVPRRRSARPARSARVHADKPRRIAAGNYGGQLVTRRNDTLWNVAERARGAGVSVEQMMMALYDQNPQAFYQQNVNALSAGKTLKIPDKGIVEQRARQDALAEFSRHNEAWNTNRSGIPRNESQVANEETVDTQLKLEAPTEATVGAEETVAPSGEQATGSQKALAPASQAATGQDAGKEKAQVDRALQDKINALEKQMANMEQLIALKDKQLADLQNPTKETPPTPPQVTTAPPTAPVQPEITTTPPPVTAQPVPASPAQPTAEPPKPVQPPVVPPKPVVKPLVRTQVQPAPIAEESSPLPWILGLTGITFASLFGWLWWRKQKILKETDAESMFRNYTTMRNTESSGGLSTTMRKASTSLTAAGAGESSFLNDFKASDFESFESFNVDHSDIDPVAEADVYLAYGRYQQAEDLMKDAIKEHPERQDCQLKLLEIYQASSNKTAFESYAKELADAGKKDDANFWAKVILLARDISTDTELFSHSAHGNVAVFPTGAESVSENVLFDVSNFIPDAEDTPPAIKVPDVEPLGAATFEVDESEGEGAIFELTEPELPVAQEEEPQGQPKEEAANGVSTADIPSGLAQQEPTFEEDNKLKDFQDNDLLDFDLGPYPSGKASGLAGSASGDVAEPIVPSNFELNKPNEKEELESYDFDFDKDFMDKDTAQKVSDNAQTEGWDPGQTLDFTLDGIPESDVEDNTINFNFELDAIPETDAGKEGNNDFSVAELTDMDEMETKLDLAKAYVDMGDADSAKDIIMQVIEHGSSEQKKSAQSLLDELNMS
jgi:pilus assembly protein FimV